MTKHYLLCTEAHLRRLDSALPGADEIALDTESHGPLTAWRGKRAIVDSLTARMTGLSLSWDESFGVYIPVGHDDGPNAPAELVAGVLRRLLGSGKRLWAHNWAYDLRVIRNFLEEPDVVPAGWGDTMVAAWLCSRGVVRFRGGKEVRGHGLKELALKHLGLVMPTYDETVGERVLVSGPTEEELSVLALDLTKRAIDNHKHRRLTKKAQNAVRVELNRRRKEQVWRDRQMNELSPQEACEYASLDATACYRLARMLGPELERKGLDTVFREVEMPTVELLTSMYGAGVRINQKRILEYKTGLLEESDRLSHEWYETVGTPITSNQKSAEAVYGPYWPLEADTPRTPGGEPSMGKEAVRRALRVCNRQSEGYRLAELKQRHSRVFKLATTYTDALLAQLPYRKDCRVRPQFLHTGTDTGRFSCRDPNLQNQPRPSEELPDIRAAFEAEEGWLLGAADWSQLEICIMAHYSRDPALLRVVLEGRSMHDITAELLGVERHTAKTINFCMNYGGGPRKLALSLGMELETGRDGRAHAPEQAVDYWRRYHEAYAGVAEYREKQAAFCRQHGYVATLFGRRRYLPKARSEDRLERWHAERQAANTPVQGSAADIAKLAGVQIRKRWLERRTPARLVLQVHDEWVAETREDARETALSDMKEIMEGCVRLRVPLTATTASGKTWSECK